MRNDFATRLGRIYGGSGRIAARIIEMAKKSLPDRFDPWQYSKDKIAQTIWNAENIARAARREPLMGLKEKYALAESIASEPAIQPIGGKREKRKSKYEGVLW